MTFKEVLEKIDLNQSSWKYEKFFFDMLSYEGEDLTITPTHDSGVVMATYWVPTDDDDVIGGGGAHYEGPLYLGIYEGKFILIYVFRRHKSYPDEIIYTVIEDTEKWLPVLRKVFPLYVKGAIDTVDIKDNNFYPKVNILNGIKSIFQSKQSITTTNKTYQIEENDLPIISAVLVNHLKQTVGKHIPGVDERFFIYTLEKILRQINNQE
nr:MAG TPA: hypothetical protein [Caudoviricetes sp.]